MLVLLSWMGDTENETDGALLLTLRQVSDSLGRAGQKALGLGDGAPDRATLR
jgi:hypothetical protein